MDSDILQIITCGICLETFNESSKCPRMLSCGHSFCHSCLVKLLAQSPCCPTCKTLIQFSNVESIPINFSLKSLNSLINIRSQTCMRNTSTNLGMIGVSHRAGSANGEQRTSYSKYLSEGYCDEHNTYKGMRCMDCKVWICGMCAFLLHKHCRNLLVEEAYKELKKQVSQKVEGELDERNTLTKRLTESLKVLDEERIFLIEEIKRKKLELKDREKRIEELESLKLEENKFCDKLKQLQTMVDNSTNEVEFSRTLKELEKMLQVGKKQIPVDLHHHHHHHPQTREDLGTLCQNRSVYAVEDRNDGTGYGKVALKEGRILINSFQQEKPEDATLFQLSELLSRFNNGSSELPKTVFLRVTCDDYNSDGEGDKDNSDDGSFEVIIETEGLCPRVRNCILLCSALKGPSYKGETMKCDTFSYEIYPAPPPVVVGIRDDDPMTPLKEGGVYGMEEGSSLFQIQLKNQPYSSLPKFGVVVSGLQRLKDLREFNDCSIKECGLVI